MAHQFESGPGQSPAASEDDFDALAELFLGESAAHGPAPLRLRADAPPTRAPEPAPTPRNGIEVLLLGHLPVRSTPWASQYAAAAARERGRPVGFARLACGELTIELVGGAPPATPPATVEGALRWCAEQHAGWVVAADELAEGDLLDAPGVDRLTLLSGADEAALVGACRLLKAATETLARTSGPPVRLCVVGETPAEAEAAAAKLARTSRLFLPREIEIAPPIERIEPTRSRALFRGAFDGGAASLVSQLRRAGAARATGERIDEPKPAAPSAGPPGRALTGYVEGLLPLPVRCPRRAEVELARDADGRIHLLVDARAEDAVRQLEEVAAWAREHAAILGHIDPAVRIAAVVRHVFTDDPPRARGLLDADVRVHLLAPVDRAVRDGHVCAPLN